MRAMVLIPGVLMGLGLLAGAYVFLHPETPPLNRVEGGTPEPLDARTGVYRHATGGLRLVVPDLDRGHRVYDPEISASAHYARDGARLDGQGALRFAPNGYSVLDAQGRTHTAERIAPQPYAISSLSARSEVTLDAWRFTPPAPRALIVILHGSGHSDRRNAYYVTLAHLLAARGAAVVLPDKRGAGRSGGDWRTASMDDLARDGAALLDAARAQLPGLREGFVGVSQGGSVAPLAAQKTDADLVVVMSSSMTDYHTQLRTEIGNAVAADPRVPTWARPLLTRAFAARARGRYPAFWRQNGSFAAIDAVAAYAGPVFIAYGALDENDNVPVSRSVAMLTQRFGEGGRVRWQVYPDLGHSLLAPDRRFDPRFIKDLTGFIGLAPADAADEE